MNIIILKITDPHGWVYATNILEHYNSFLGINYSPLGTNTLDGYNVLNVPKEYFSIEQLEKGIKYWFTQKEYINKRNLLILTDDIEEQNKELISMIKNITISRDLDPSNNCIIICNDFMYKYYNKDKCFMT